MSLVWRCLKGRIIPRRATIYSEERRAAVREDSKIIGGGGLSLMVKLGAWDQNSDCYLWFTAGKNEKNNVLTFPWFHTGLPNTFQQINVYDKFVYLSLCNSILHLNLESEN